MSTLTKSMFLNLPKVLLAAIYYWILFSQKSSIWLVAVVVAIVIVDIVDGKIIIRDTVSRRLVDGLVDKIIVNFIFLITVFYYKLPFWFYAPLFFRDMAIILGSVYLRKKQVTIFPNSLHKIAMLSIAISGIGIILGLRSVWIIMAMHSLCFIALFDYGLLFAFGNLPKGAYRPSVFEGFKRLWA